MYKITITKEVTSEVTVRGDYEILEKRPYTQEEVDEANSSFFSEDKEQTLKSIYGYGENYKKLKTENVEVLSQSVEELDLTEVIKAINGIGE